MNFVVSDKIESTKYFYIIMIKKEKKR